MNITTANQTASGNGHTKLRKKLHCLALAVIAMFAWPALDANAQCSVLVWNNDVYVYGDDKDNIFDIRFDVVDQKTVITLNHEGEEIFVEGDYELAETVGEKVLKIWMYTKIDDLEIQSKGGDDEISIEDYSQSTGHGDIEIYSHGGNDTITLDNVDLRKLYIDSGTGNDDVELGHPVPGNNSLPTFQASSTDIRTGDGFDQIRTHHVLVEDMLMLTGDDADEIRITFILTDSLFINTEDGNDGITVEGMGRANFRTNNSCMIHTGEGNDFCSMGLVADPYAFELSSLVVYLEEGDDEFGNWMTGYIGSIGIFGGRGYDTYICVPFNSAPYITPLHVGGFEEHFLFGPIVDWFGSGQ